MSFFGGMSNGSDSMSNHRVLMSIKFFESINGSLISETRLAGIKKGCQN